MAEVVFEVAFVAQAVGIVQHSMAAAHTVSLFALVLDLKFAVSYEKFGIVVDILQHLIDETLTVVLAISTMLFHETIESIGGLDFVF